MNKITKEWILDRIASVEYQRIPDSTVTICNITMVKGFSVRGESACVDPREFNLAVGESLAYDDAFRKLWPLEGYLLAEGLWIDRNTPRGFGWALSKLEAGAKVARSGWNGKGLWLELQRPDDQSKMTLPYIFMSYPNDAKNTPGARVPWLASQTDMLAKDWMEP